MLIDFRTLNIVINRKASILTVNQYSTNVFAFTNNSNLLKPTVTNFWKNQNGQTLSKIHFILTYSYFKGVVELSIITVTIVFSRTDNGHYSTDGHEEQSEGERFARGPKTFFCNRLTGCTQNLNVYVGSAIQTRHPVRRATLPHRTANKNVSLS